MKTQPEYLTAEDYRKRMVRGRIVVLTKIGTFYADKLTPHYTTDMVELSSGQYRLMLPYALYLSSQ